MCEFHPEAAKELEKAVAYYDSINPKLGNEFIEQVQQAL